MEFSQYVLETLREDDESVLYWGEHSKQRDSPSVLLLAPTSMQPALTTLKKIEHEYSLRDELDSAWAVRSLAMSEERGQTTLVLEDRGVETLDRFLAAPMEMKQFLRFAVGLATPLGGLHKRELIHEEANQYSVNPATGKVWHLGFGIASRLLRELQAPGPPDFIAGHSLTLPSKLGHEPHRDTRYVLRFYSFAGPHRQADGYLDYFNQRWLEFGES